MNQLAKKFSFPILSEEAYIEYSKRSKWDSFWLIDPLDGTKDFIAQNDEFTINIALIEKNIPIAGFIYAPALDLLYYATSGNGAYINKNGIEKKISNNYLKDEILVALSKFHNVPEVEVFCRENCFHTKQSFGSSLKFCKLAEGIVDIYPRLAPTREWDIGAGHCILKEANCSIIDLKTKKEPLYNKKNILNNHFIAYANWCKFTI